MTAELPNTPNEQPKGFHPDRGFLGFAATIGGYALTGPVARALKVHFYGSSAKTFGQKLNRYLGATLLCQTFWTAAAVYDSLHVYHKQALPASKALIESTPCVLEQGSRVYSGDCKPRFLEQQVSPIFGFTAGPYAVHEYRSYQSEFPQQNRYCAKSIVSLTDPKRKESMSDWYEIPDTCRYNMDFPANK